MFSLTLLLHWYEWGVPSPVKYGERHSLRDLLSVNPSAPIAYQEWLLHQVSSVFKLSRLVFTDDRVAISIL